MDIVTQAALLLGLVVLAAAFTVGLWPVITHQFQPRKTKRYIKRIYPYAPLDLDLSRVRVTDR